MVSRESWQVAGSRWTWLSLVIVSWIVTRAILLADTLSGEVPLDVVAYQRWALLLLSEGAPSDDTAFVYPPGGNLIFLITEVINGDSFYRIFTLLGLLSDLAILLALLWTASKGSSKLMIAPWAWVVMGFAAGPLMYQRFDIFAAVFGVLAVLAVAKPIISGVLSGIGLLVKLWPEISLLALPRKRLLRGVIANVMTVAGGWLALELWMGNSLGFVANVMNKGLSVEAVAAYPFLLLRALVGSHEVTGQFGSWEVVGPGVAMAATVTTLFGVLLLLGLFALRISGRLENVAPGDVVLLGVLIFVVTHKINSLQYGIWIAAMTSVALVFASSRVRGPAVLLTLMLLVADHVIWTYFVEFISGNILLLLLQGLRLVLLLTATAWLAVSVLRDGQRSHSVSLS